MFVDNTSPRVQLRDLLFQSHGVPGVLKADFQASGHYNCGDKVGVLCELSCNVHV